MKNDLDLEYTFLILRIQQNTMDNNKDDFYAKYGIYFKDLVEFPNFDNYRTQLSYILR